MERKIIDRSPFETIDKPGVGWLVRLAAWVGREAKPELKLGICGEHGGDPESIEFFHMAGLDYVSCSPYRVPIARVAAAQAAIAARRNSHGRLAPSRPCGAASGCQNRVVSIDLARRPPVPARRPVLPGRAGAARGGVRAAHAVPARPRPDRALQGVPAAQAQDAGVRGARGRPLPHAAHPHARDDADLAHGRRGRCGSTRTSSEAIGLGHDLGHPPFGHIGEDVLDRCARERFGRGFRHNEHSLRVVDVLERLNLTDAGARRDPAPLQRGGRAGDARGQDRAARRPHRLHQPRHRRRACAPACSRVARPAGGGDRRARRHRLAPHRPARARPRRALRARRRHRPGRGGRRRDAAPARLHVPERLPRPDRAGGAREDRARAARRCSTGSASTPRSCRPVERRRRRRPTA